MKDHVLLPDCENAIDPLAQSKRGLKSVSPKTVCFLFGVSALTFGFASGMFPSSSYSNLPLTLFRACPTGYTRYEAFCYKVVLTPETFEDAEKHCIMEGAHLVSILSKAEREFVAGMHAATVDQILIEGVKKAYMAMWTGLRYDAESRNWVWTDGESFLSWEQEEPNFAVHGASFDKNKWTWNWTDTSGHTKKSKASKNQTNLMLIRNMDAKITTEVWAMSKNTAAAHFMCKKPVGVPKPVPPPCSKGYLFFEDTNHCYKLHHTPELFDVADSICQSEGGRLTSIHSLSEQLLVLGLYHSGMKSQDSNSSAWIGLKSNIETLRWEWIDGTPFDYDRWSSNEKDGLLYGELQQLESGWTSSDDNEKKFICKQASTMAKGHSSSSPCEDGYTWLAHTGNCYKPISENTVENATAMCHVEHATLAPVHSKLENFFMIGLVVNAKEVAYNDQEDFVEDIWIGLSGSRIGNETDIEYKNWAVGEPSSRSHQASIATFGGKWSTDKDRAVAICMRLP